MSADGERPTADWRPSIAILAFVLAYLGAGFLTLDATTRFVPVLAGGVTLLLVVIDMLRVAFSGSSIVDTNAPDAAVGTAGRELKATLFLAGGVTGIYLVGFMLAIPLYLFASIAFLGKQSTRVALIVALLTSLAIYLLFAVALAYELYPGMLFA